MKTLDIELIVPDFSSNKGGEALYFKMIESIEDHNVVELKFNNKMNLSSSFLNSSIGMYLENFGLESFKSKFKFRGNKNQFKTLSFYISKYSELHVAN